MKSLVKFAFLVISIVIIISSNIKAETMLPIPTKDAVIKLIAQLKTASADEKLVEKLIDIGSHYLYYGDPEAEKYINRALFLSKKLNYKEGLIKSMCLHSGFLFYIKKQNQTGIKVADEAIILSKKYNIIEWEAYSIYIKGVYFIDSDPKTAIAFFTKARIMYRSLGAKANEAFLVKSIGEIQKDLGQLDQSLKNLLEALEIYKGAGHHQLNYTQTLISGVYRSMGNDEQALEYALHTIKSAEKVKDSAEIVKYYYNVSQILISLGHESQALPYLSYVLENITKTHYNFFMHRAAGINFSKILLKTGKPKLALSSYKKIMARYPAKPKSLEQSTDNHYLGDLYFSLKQYDKAEKLFLNMLGKDEKNPYPDRFILICLLKLGNFYIARGDFAKAQSYINKAKVNSVLRLKTEISNLNLQQYKVDSAFGNYLSAIKYYQAYQALSDSVYNEKKSKQILSLNVQFETEKKLHKIDILTTENSKQKVILERRVFERNVFTAGAVMLLMLLLLAINRYKLKQKANVQLQEQQDLINKKNKTLNNLLEEKVELLASKDRLIVEKEWLIKEVHHRVKNNLQMISTLLYSQSTYLKDEVAKAAIEESQQRIHAISIVHKKLYQSEKLQVVSMKDYIIELVEYLQECFDAGCEVEFKVELDLLELDVSKAISLGIILNEAITNSLKYAFTSTSDPNKTITILLVNNQDNGILLLIKDNGIGLPNGFKLQDSDSLGISLMRGLSAQINADFYMKSDNGTLIYLEFKEDILL